MQFFHNLIPKAQIRNPTPCILRSKTRALRKLRTGLQRTHPETWVGGLGLRVQGAGALNLSFIRESGGVGPSQVLNP